MRKTVMVGFTLLLVACASPKVVQEKQVGDGQLSCAGIKEQISEADEFERKARNERGVTGTNVAAAIFFWPAMLATYSNTDDAIKAANERKRSMYKLSESKGCEEISTSDNGDIEGKIKRLAELRDKGLLTDDEYVAAKKQALGIK